MSALKAYFNYSLNQSSPIQTDLQRVVNYDELGNEFITWEPIDYSSLQASHGSASDWSLDSLIKAGIDPAFPIHTGNPTRLEGVGVINDAASIVDEILSENSNSEN